MKRSSLVDIIKGIMILFIIITHFSWSYPADYLRYGFVFYIDMAIPVFMIISGYLYAAKYKREGFNFYKIYSLRQIISQGLRFLIPFCGIYIVELLYSKLRHTDITTLELAKSFFNGGIGPGSYYTPIMLQFIIVVPLIALIVEKYRWGGYCVCLILNVFWEIISYSWNMSDHVYAITIFRYFSVIAFGCFIATEKRRLSYPILIVMQVCGIIWQVILCYRNARPIFMNYSWARVNFLSSFLVMPLMYYLLKYKVNTSIKITPLQILGKASYDIYLVQMFYYAFLNSYVGKHIASRGYHLLFNICICCVVGTLYYLIENPITRGICSKVKNHSSNKNFSAIINEINSISCK